METEKNKADEIIQCRSASQPVSIYRVHFPLHHGRIFDEPNILQSNSLARVTRSRYHALYSGKNRRRGLLGCLCAVASGRRKRRNCRVYGAVSCTASGARRLNAHVILGDSSSNRNTEFSVPLCSVEGWSLPPVLYAGMPNKWVPGFYTGVKREQGVGSLFFSAHSASRGFPME